MVVIGTAAGPPARRRVAVIGSGVAGLTAAWSLRHTADVTLYEADDRLGGHAHTHDIPLGPGGTGGSVAVDTGFIVHNHRTYPTLLRLFADLGVATQESDMSMSVHCDGCGLEYAGARGVSGLFAQPSALVRGRYLRMLREVTVFHRQARALLAQPAESGSGDITLAAFLAAGRYSRYFVAHFMVPVVASVWSCSPTTAMDYPARYLFSFLDHHGMLSVTGSPPWRTVTGGSRSYVEKVAKELSAVATSTPVRALHRISGTTTGGVEIHDDADGVAAYDAAVVATHPDQALRLLAAPTPDERAVLGAFRYSRNETVLHTDTRVLPRSRRAQASWNYRMSACQDAPGAGRPDHVVVSYDMTRLQRLPGPERFLVTLNGDSIDSTRVDPGSVLARMVYEHPVYTPESVAAQARLVELDDATVAFAGAYHGWGFHEDGCLSGFRAAQKLGGAW